MGSSTPSRSAAFFDVDGTLTRTNIVHYYVYFRRRKMSPLMGRLWLAVYMFKCLGYLVLDKIDRSRLNVVFYRSYAGFKVETIRAMVTDCYEDVIKPRQFEEVGACLGEHRDAGRLVVLVTGSLDFIMEPLALDLGADGLVAASLQELEGKFTGELNGPPVGDGEKARLIQAYAVEHDIDLAQSYAYGDSIADLPMLESVGHPHVVNPDASLAAVATKHGWPIHHWKQVSSRKDSAR